jgi:hypothetical protein
MVAQALQLHREGLFEPFLIVGVGRLPQYDQPNRSQSYCQRNFEKHSPLTPMPAPNRIEAFQQLLSYGREQNKKIPGSDGAERAIS